MDYLVIENLKKDFPSSSGKIGVLKGVSFSVGKGEAVAVIGPSGGGKTTLLRCINFLEKTDGGNMILDGETLISDGEDDKFFKEKYLRRKRLNFGLVFQQYNLFPHCTVKKNVSLAPTFLMKDEFRAYKKVEKDPKARRKFKKRRKDEIAEETMRLLAKVGLGDKANEYPCSLSGGQEQRASIARALALHPKVLCFDEPTSALDPELTGEVQKVMKSLRDDGTTMVIVTHDMEFAKAVSDRAIFIQDGVVVESGKTEELFSNPKTERLQNFLNTTVNTEDNNGIVS